MGPSEEWVCWSQISLHLYSTPPYSLSRYFCRYCKLVSTSSVMGDEKGFLSGRLAGPVTTVFFSSVQEPDEEEEDEEEAENISKIYFS